MKQALLDSLEMMEVQEYVRIYFKEGIIALPKGSGS